MEEVYKINDNIAWREIDGQILILDSQQNQMAHDLNEMGTFIFLSFSQGKSLNVIKKLISQEYPELSRDQLNDDIQIFLDKLLQLKLVIK